jgi:hypothetical protein
MEHLTADGTTPPDILACASPPDLELNQVPEHEPDLDCVLARAIRRLIAVTRVPSETVPNLD